MKYIVRIFLFSLLLQSFQCDDEVNENNAITPEMLAIKKQEILEYISTFSCNEASDCLYIAFGAKPCGGPREFLVYPNIVDQSTLETMVNDYYDMDNQYNIQTNAVSDCMVVGPPNTIDCVNNICRIID